MSNRGRATGLAGVLAMLLAGAPVHAGDAEDVLDRLAAEADVVAIVEVMATETTAMAADGPMYVDAKVLKVLKGGLPVVPGIRFGATAWTGPTYRSGERRVVFLRRVADGDAYYRDVRWSSLEAGVAEVFFTGSPPAGDVSAVALPQLLRDPAVIAKSTQQVGPDSISADPYQ